MLQIKLDKIEYIKVGVIYTCGLWFIRNILNFYGLHTLVLCIFLGFLIKAIINVDWKWAFISSLLSFLIFFLGESIFIPLIINYFNIDYLEFINNKTVSLFILSYLIKLPLLVCALMIYYYNFSIIGLVAEEDLIN